MSAAKVELGRRLFYDGRVAGLNYMSCSTCHKPELAFSDGRPVAIGLTGQRHPRNSQGLANVAYLPRLTWADPGVTSLEDQAKLPLFGEHPVEMMANGREEAIVARLAVDLDYRRQFAAAFPESGGRIDFVAIRKALAAFERTIAVLRFPLGPVAARRRRGRGRRGGEAGRGAVPGRSLALRALPRGAAVHRRRGRGRLPQHRALRSRRPRRISHGQPGADRAHGRARRHGSVPDAQPAQRRRDRALHARRLGRDALAR